MIAVVSHKRGVVHALSTIRPGVTLCNRWLTDWPRLDASFEAYRSHPTNLLLGRVCMTCARRSLEAAA